MRRPAASHTTDMHAPVIMRSDVSNDTFKFPLPVCKRHSLHMYICLLFSTVPQYIKLYMIAYFDNLIFKSSPVLIVSYLSSKAALNIMFEIPRPSHISFAMPAPVDPSPSPATWRSPANGRPEYALSRSYAPVHGLYVCISCHTYSLPRLIASILRITTMVAVRFQCSPFLKSSHTGAGCPSFMM